MVFRHKLSVRFAQMKRGAFTAAVILAACESIASPTNSVHISPTTTSVAVGQTTQLGVTPNDAPGKSSIRSAVGWTTSNASVASVNASGLVTGVAAGSATITATSGAADGTAIVTVVDASAGGGSAGGISTMSFPNDPVGNGTAGWTRVNDYNFTHFPAKADEY